MGWLSMVLIFGAVVAFLGYVLWRMILNQAVERLSKLDDE